MLTFKVAIHTNHEFCPNPTWDQYQKRGVFLKYKSPCELDRNICFLPWLHGSRTLTITVNMLTFKGAIQTYHAFLPRPKCGQNRKWGVFLKYKRPCETSRKLRIFYWLPGSRKLNLSVNMLTFKGAIQTYHAFVPRPKCGQHRKRGFSLSTRGPANLPVRLVLCLTTWKPNPNPNPKYADVQSGNTNLSCICPKAKIWSEPKMGSFP